MLYRIASYCLIICWLGSGQLFGQQSEGDSLLAVWNNAELAKEERLNAYQRYIYLNRFYAHNPDTALLMSAELIELARKARLPALEAKGYSIEALTNYFQNQYEQAIQSHLKSLTLSESIGDIKSMGGTLNNIALAYNKLGDLPNALEYNLQALAVRREVGKMENVAKSLQNIAIVYINQQNFSAALSYAEESYTLNKSLGRDVGVANAALSMANVFSDQGEFEKALRYYQEALALYQQLEISSSEATCLDNIGNVYARQGNYQLAIDYQLKALRIREEIGQKNGLSLSHNNLGSSYASLQQWENSLFHCQQALPLAEASKERKLIFETCECLYEAHQGLGNDKQALFFLQRFMVQKDSIENVEKAKLFEEVESKYELKEKEAQIAQQERDLAEARADRSSVINIALVLFAVLTVFFFWLRSRMINNRQQAELVAERERAEAEKLRELDQLKSNFFANISHEFRTPLTLIMSPLDQMIKGSLHGEPNKYLRTMQRNGHRLQELINQLLDLSKLESGGVQLHPEPGNLSQFLRAIAQSFGSLADRKQIDFQVDGPQSNLFALYDKDALEKILTNLLSNAFKFTPVGGEIHIDFHHAGEQLQIVIKDNGVGISEDKLDSIFERFYSMDHQADLQVSSGIGLALTKELVVLYGGQIAVESVEGKGTKFTVDLPIQLMAQSNVSGDTIPPIRDKAMSSMLVAAETEVLSGPIDAPLVLVVEDNDDVRSYLCDQLRKEYQVAEALNGKIGLELAKELQPLLIVSDVMMPEMDGNELCKSLKIDPLTSHIPIILLTAKADQRDKLEGLETGADAYLTKPFDHEELSLRIRKLIEQRKQLREKFSSDFKFKPSEVTVTSVDAALLEKIRSIIETNMEDEAFSVVELSKEIGMSRSHLFRKLKALTNQSPNQIIREMRLIRAKELLQKGAGNSSEVAFMVGFNSAAYFTKCFGDYFGVPPTQMMGG